MRPPNIKKEGNVKRIEKYTKTSPSGDINKIIFPHDMQVGLPDDRYNSTISGSIHVTREGKSYLVAGTGITITSASNGQITIESSGGGGGSGDITSVIAGNGLTGGATSGDATLNIGAGGGIIVNTNDIEIDNSIVATLTGSVFSGTIKAPALSGSLTRLLDDTSYLKAGSNINVITASNGSITISFSPTVTNHVHNFWLSATPTGNPTNYFYGSWSSSTLTSVDPELASANYLWKYFPTGGEFKKVYGFGDSTGNFSSANPFIENAVFAIHKWSNDFVTLTGATALRPAIFHVTASPGDSYTIDSGTYYHRATYDFDLTAGTGSPIISAGDTICISFKGAGGGNGFGYSNFFIHWEENIS